MISFNFDEYCCGCGSCKNSCPVNAIAMKANFEGFLMPEINKEICINCDKCDKVCPYENTKVDIEKFSLNDLIIKRLTCIIHRSLKGKIQHQEVLCMICHVA